MGKRGFKGIGSFSEQRGLPEKELGGSEGESVCSVV